MRSAQPWQLVVVVVSPCLGLSDNPSFANFFLSSSSRHTTRYSTAYGIYGYNTLPSFLSPCIAQPPPPPLLSLNVLSVLNAFHTIIYRFVLISAYGRAAAAVLWTQCNTLGFPWHKHLFYRCQCCDLGCGAAATAKDTKRKHLKNNPVHRHF